MLKIQMQSPCTQENLIVSPAPSKGTISGKAKTA